MGLVDLCEKHTDALNYDLFTKTGYTIDDIGDKIGWGAFYSFVKNLNESSALSRDLNQEVYTWGTTLKTNVILADIFDMLSAIHYTLASMGGKPKKPKPYPRPGQKDKSVEHFGKDGVKDIRSWIKSKMH